MVSSDGTIFKCWMLSKSPVGKVGNFICALHKLGLKFQLNEAKGGPFLTDLLLQKS